MRVIAFDTETHLIAPGNQRPRLVCLSYAIEAGPAGVLDREQAYEFLKQNLADANTLLVCHNAAYDLGVAASNWPHLVPLIFEAYECDRIVDTNHREKLICIAEGTHHKGGDYSLAELSAHYLGKDRTAEKEGGGSGWRLRYSELDGVPIAEYPQAAYEYALEDATDTLAIYLSQSDSEDQFRQARKAWWLGLMSAWGMITDPVRVAALDTRVRTEYERLKLELIEIGLVRVKQTRKMKDDPDGQWKAGDTLTTYHREEKKARKLMFETCEWMGIKPTLTDSAKARKRIDIKAGAYRPTEVDDCALSSEACEKVAHGPDDGPCTDGDECPRCTLTTYGEYSGLSTYISTDLPILWSGTKHPIHTRVDTLKETGRTGMSNPNLQNQKREGGVRECYVPRPGKVFICCDLDQFELRTMAQVCVTTFGWSKLADALNKGDDPHLRVAAMILNAPYEEVAARLAIGDKETYDARQLGKIANFGFPGGLGVASLVDYAWSNFRIRITEQKARELKAVWLNTYPEFNLYFKWIASHIGDNERGAFKHLFSNRIRGNCFFTQLCNTPFQGLGADATGEAGFLVSKACYVEQASPLYGSRIVNYVHDDLMAETDDGPGAPAAAAELERLMIVGANRMLSDVPATATACLARRWSKGAKPVFDSERVLVPWEEAA